jgi:large subunit ribosomal protein L23
MDPFLITRPHITEKAALLSESGKYVFVVQKHASSAEVKKALKQIYNVDAVKVNIVNIPAKRGRYGRIRTETKAGYKKAIVTLKKGQSMDIIPK